MQVENSQENSGTRGVEAEKEMFVVIKDGYGNDLKVLNFKNESICPKEGIVELIPMKTSSRHQNWVSFRSIWDKNNQAMIGIPDRIDPRTKEWVFQKITLTDMETLDLSIELDRKKYLVIKNSHFLKGSPNLRDKPLYYLRDKEQEAKAYLQNVYTKRKATTIAEGLYGEDLVDMARNLGIAPEQNSIFTLQMAVIQKAEDKPKEFLAIWDSPTRKELTIL